MLSNAVQSSSSGDSKVSTLCVERKKERKKKKKKGTQNRRTPGGTPENFWLSSSSFHRRLSSHVPSFCHHVLLAGLLYMPCIRQSACPIVEMSVSERSVGVCIVISVAAFVLYS